MKTLVLMISLLLLLGCSSKKSAEELLTEANKFLDDGKIPEAVETYQLIIKDYNDVDAAPEALSHLAAVYQNKLVKNIPEQESLTEAANLFYKIYTDYPQNNLAPMGLFMSGFIYANELQQFEKATSAYNIFLEEFPDHELAASAKEELENMGLTPEEILQKNLAKGN